MKRLKEYRARAIIEIYLKKTVVSMTYEADYQQWKVMFADGPIIFVSDHWLSLRSKQVK